MMEIPRPRLKALQELDAEEKVAEKAVIAIRRKTLQVDTDLERIREEVEGELERLESQRSQLEANMQQLMEEQAMILGALSELEDRQGRHKQNLTMLKDEEFEIEAERKDLNLALKQLRSKQRSLRDMVNKKYFAMDGAKSSKRFSASPPDYSTFKSDARQFISEEPVFQKWRSMNVQSEPEPKVKIVASPSIRENRPEAEVPQGNMPAPVAMPQFAQGQPLPEMHPLKAGDSSARGHVGRPSILKRIRSAADRYLPEPFRLNKPTAALLEEKADQSESTTAIETSGSPSEDNVEAPIKPVNPGPVMRRFPSSKPAPIASVEAEINQFEEKLSELDEEEAPGGQTEDFRTRISSIVRMGRNTQTAGAGKAAPGPLVKKEAPNLQGTMIPAVPRSPIKADSNEANKFPNVGAQKSDEHKIASVRSLNAASMLRPELRASSAEDRARKTKGEIVRKLTTEAKLARLQNKLQEMKSALKTLSKSVPDGEVELHSIPGRPLFHAPAAKHEPNQPIYRKITPTPKRDQAGKSAPVKSSSKSKKKKR
ncbi:MAG TPA: hypothetical protein VJI13_00135 [Candidatus Norongarragalinales archaeon]|nr:hypothetical protein [Candidatus Norongarragalinales archaeon]